MRSHGTRACYVHGPATGQGAGCRCEPCRAANRAYVDQVNRLTLYGAWEPFVDPAEVIAHLHRLSRMGVGRRTIAQASGVGETAITKLRAGRTRKVRPETAERLLSVTGMHRAGGALVEAGPTWDLINEMLGVGIPKARIAQALGRKTPALQLGREYVVQRNAAAVQDLHDRARIGTKSLREACRHEIRSVA